MNSLESIALELRLKNMKSSGEKAKCLMEKEFGVDSKDVLDLPASFDGSWCLRSWTANRRIVSGVGEVTAQKVTFPLNIFSVNEEILNGKLHCWYSEFYFRLLMFPKTVLLH